MEVKEKASVWVIDPVHTRIRFETKYLLITTISGWFSEFEGSVTTSSDSFNHSKIRLKLYTNSINTGNTERDNHLRSADFFDTENYPSLTFTSTDVVVRDANIQVTGELCIKNIRETISFEAKHLGFVTDPLGNRKSAFEMQLVLNRKDFGISWNQFFGNSGVLLSDEVKIFGDVQLLKVS